MTNISSKERREALLGELESIRELLDEDSTLTEEEQALLDSDLDIPLLLPDPDDEIPTLAMEQEMPGEIPVLIPELDEVVLADPSVSNAHTVVRHAVTPEDIERATTSKSPDAPPRVPETSPLESIRAAAAKVAANAARHRQAPASPAAASPTTVSTAQSANPFLPEHIRNRLHGTELSQHIRDSAARPRTAAATSNTVESEALKLQAELESIVEQPESVKPAVVPAVPVPSFEQQSLIPVAISLSPVEKDKLIEEVMQALMPALEQQLRQILSEKLSG